MRQAWIGLLYCIGQGVYDFVFQQIREVPRTVRPSKLAPLVVNFFVLGQSVCDQRKKVFLFFETLT